MSIPSPTSSSLSSSSHSSSPLSPNPLTLCVSCRLVPSLSLCLTCSRPFCSLSCYNSHSTICVEKLRKRKEKEERKESIRWEEGKRRKEEREGEREKEREKVRKLVDKYYNRERNGNDGNDGEEDDDGDRNSNDNNFEYNDDETRRKYVHHRDHPNVNPIPNSNPKSHIHKTEIDNKNHNKNNQNNTKNQDRNTDNENDDDSDNDDTDLLSMDDNERQEFHSYLRDQIKKIERFAITDEDFAPDTTNKTGIIYDKHREVVEGEDSDNHSNINKSTSSSSSSPSSHDQNDDIKNKMKPIDIISTLLTPDIIQQFEREVTSSSSSTLVFPFIPYWVPSSAIQRKGDENRNVQDNPNFYIHVNINKNENPTNHNDIDWNTEMLSEQSEWTPCKMSEKDIVRWDKMGKGKNNNNNNNNNNPINIDIKGTHINNNHINDKAPTQDHSQNQSTDINTDSPSLTFNPSLHSNPFPLSLLLSLPSCLSSSLPLSPPPHPQLLLHIIEVIVSYVYCMRLYVGEMTGECIVMMGEISGVMKTTMKGGKGNANGNDIFQMEGNTVPSLLYKCIEKIRYINFLPPPVLLALLQDVTHMLINMETMGMVAIKHLGKGCKKERKGISEDKDKDKDTGEMKLSMSEKHLEEMKKGLYLVEKKMIYFQSFIHQVAGGGNGNVNVFTLASAEVWKVREEERKKYEGKGKKKI